MFIKSDSGFKFGDFLKNKIRGLRTSRRKKIKESFIVQYEGESFHVIITMERIDMEKEKIKPDFILLDLEDG